jgi:hypothetical protein
MTSMIVDGTGIGIGIATIALPDGIAIAGARLPLAIVLNVNVTVTVPVSVPTIVRGRIDPLPLGGKITEVANGLHLQSLLVLHPSASLRRPRSLPLLLPKPKKRQAKKRSNDSSERESRLGKQKELQRLQPLLLRLQPRRTVSLSTVSRPQVSVAFFFSNSLCLKSWVFNPFVFRQGPSAKLSAPHANAHLAAAAVSARLGLPTKAKLPPRPAGLPAKPSFNAFGKEEGGVKKEMYRPEEGGTIELGKQEASKAEADEDEDDDEDVVMAPPAGPSNGAAEEEDDPLDAFMSTVTSEVEKVDEADKAKMGGAEVSRLAEQLQDESDADEPEGDGDELDKASLRPEDILACARLALFFLAYRTILTIWIV